MTDENPSRQKRLEFLLEFTNSVASNLSLPDVLRNTAPGLRRIMECDLAAIHLPDQERKMLRTIGLDIPGGEDVFKQDEVLPLEGTIIGKTFLDANPIAISVNTDEAKAFQEYDRAVALGIQFACVLPLRSRNRVLGVLSLARRTDNAFQDEDVHFLEQVANQLAMAIENALAYEEIAALKDKLAQEKLYLEDEIKNQMDFEEIVGESPLLLNVLKQVETVAPTNSTVLILGETGTGKELIARAIHSHSKRKERTFVKLNCAAIPTGLLESELFGHEKGAFTGAIAQRIGRLELADNGTLFLDEIGDISLELQSKLLRALQEREFERLGSSKTRIVDVRLIAATNRNLQKMVDDREFRSDLYYRLNVFPIRVPSLRERSGDIPMLVRHFTQKHARRMEKKIDSIPSNALESLASWHWPGNIRELENFMERAVILTQGTVLNVPIRELSNNIGTNASLSLEEGEREKIIRVLKETKGRLAGPDGAAERLGIKRTTLIGRLKKFGINPRQWS